MKMKKIILVEIILKKIDKVWLTVYQYVDEVFI